MSEKLLQLKNFHWRLWVALSSLALIPAVYQTVRTFLISTGSQNEAFHIIGQMEWFDLINETLQAFLIVPLYSVLNKIFKNQPGRFASAVFQTGLLVFVLYAVFSTGVFLQGKTLIRAMNADGLDLSAVSRYLNLETAAFMIGIVVSFIQVVFVVAEKHKNVYIFLAVRAVLSLIADFFLIPYWGVYGAAVSNILVNTALAVIGLALLHAQKYIRICRVKSSDFAVFKEWCWTGAFSGLQQFLDNLIYAVMICKMVNLVEEQGNYWLANNFIWGWLLIPITALAEVIRSDCKNGYAELKRFSYCFVSCVCVVFWELSIPLWKPFYCFAENLSSAEEIFSITIKLVPFYIAYAGSSIIDNIFIGLGKTAYNMLNSLLVNLVYYGIFYGLYLTRSIVFDMDTIILMFGLGMVFHFVISLAEEKFFQRRETQFLDRH